jgi:hypothetical protein
VEGQRDQKGGEARDRAVRALSESDRDALLGEGERLVRFVGDGAEAFEVRFAQGV